MKGPKIRRLYFTAREVCSRIGISHATLRNWEHRFIHLKPARNQSGRKLYRPGDLKLILRIKQFKEADYTDEKIESILWPGMEHTHSGASQPNLTTQSTLAGIRKELQDILMLLDPGQDKHTPTRN